jgi:two-component system, NarL family, invasion response regulator UvrY
MRVLIVDDHPIVISACRALLSEDVDITVREAHTIAAARLAISESVPDEPN